MVSYTFKTLLVRSKAQLGGIVGVQYPPLAASAIRNTDVYFIVYRFFWPTF